MGFLKKVYSYRLLVGLILFSILAFIFQNNLRLDPYEKGSLKEFQKVINERIIEVDQYLKNTSESLDSMPAHDLMQNIPDSYNSLYENYGIVLLGYKNDSLIFWTDNLIPVDNYSINKGLNNSVVKLTDGWYVVRSIQRNDCKFYGLIHSKK
ncbi:MAG: hypothetical protein MZV64_70155 [Ignavibacteriales bacterium]|nr:hypothetical protein [Ignavibacteriales bacterium]